MGEREGKRKRERKRERDTEREKREREREIPHVLIHSSNACNNNSCGTPKLGARDPATGAMFSCLPEHALAGGREFGRKLRSNASIPMWHAGTPNCAPSEDA